MLHSHLEEEEEHAPPASASASPETTSEVKRDGEGGDSAGQGRDPYVERFAVSQGRLRAESPNSVPIRRK